MVMYDVIVVSYVDCVFYFGDGCIVVDYLC